MKKRKIYGRIRYEEDFMNRGEHYVFEIKSNHPDSEWGLETAYPLIDDRISYQALTHIREWIGRGIEFQFGDWEP